MTWMCHIHPVCPRALNNYLRVFSYLLGFTSVSILENVPSCTPTENLRSSNQSWKAPEGSCVKWIPLGKCESHVLMAGSSPNSRDFSNELPVSRSSSRVLRLEAAAPHYHNNQLQVKVFWKSRLPGKWSQNKSSCLTLTACSCVNCIDVPSPMLPCGPGGMSYHSTVNKIPLDARHIGGEFINQELMRSFHQATTISNWILNCLRRPHPNYTDRNCAGQPFQFHRWSVRVLESVGAKEKQSSD